MSVLTSRISRISPSATLEMTALAAELKRLNKPVYNMSVGEPDFPTPKNIQDAGIFAMQNGETKYTPGSGTHELKTAIINKLKRDNNLQYSINQIVVSCGGKHSLYNACQVLFQKNDEVRGRAGSHWCTLVGPLRHRRDLDSEISSNFSGVARNTWVVPAWSVTNR